MSTSSKPNARIVAKYYFGHVKRYPYSVLGIVLLVPITMLCGSFLPTLIVSNVLTKLSKGNYITGRPWQSFGSSIIAYAALIIFTGFVVWRIIDLLTWRLEGNIQKNIARQIFNHLSNESADFHANNFSGSLVSQYSKTLGSYIRIADSTIYSTLELISSLVIAVIIMLPKAPLFVLILVTFTCIYVGVALYVTRRVREQGAKLSAAESKQTGYLADMIGNVMAVKSFAGEEYEKSEFDTITNKTHKRLRLVTRAHTRRMLYFSGVSRSVMTLTFFVAIISVVNFHAPVGIVFLIMSYSNNIVDQLFQFSNSSLRNYNRSVGDSYEMINILNKTPEILDPVQPVEARMLRGAIVFNEVTFSHKDATKPIFNSLSLRIKPGEKVGLVGLSGSGKTSLTRILLRFSDIQSGAIEIDGQNIAHVTQADLRRTISYVPQEPILFHRTIANNIGYGRTGATMQEITAIAKQSNAHEFITKLPDGYDTVVGERGVKLSGGQRQRIAIARAMLKNAPILVLDEATSALDSESEALIQDALWKLMEGRTAIVIAHRLSTIQKMDRIIVLDNGHIIEEGSHKDLLYQKGVYAGLWNRQSGGFLEA